MYQYSAHAIYYYPRELMEYFEFIGKSPEDADAELLIKYRDHLYSNGLKSKSIRKKLYVIKTWYRIMFEDNPTIQKWKDRRLTSKTINLTLRGRGGTYGYKPLKIEQLRKLVKTAEDHSTEDDCEVECFIKLLVFTGGRAQFYGLMVDNIDFDNKRIRLMVKGKKMHNVPIVGELEEVLKRHLKIRTYKSKFVFKNGKQSYVDGNPGQTFKNMTANTKNAERILQRLATHAGISKYDSKFRLIKGESIHPHRIRKTLAHEGGALGLDLETVSEILGHTDISITKKYYRGRMDDTTRKRLEDADLLGHGKKKKIDTSNMSEQEKKELIRKLISEM